MNKLFYGLYVGAVLLISGVSPAYAVNLGNYQIQYQSPVQIDDIAANPHKLELAIEGSLPNPCYGQPSALLSQDADEPTILILHLTSPMPFNACRAQVQAFSTTVDLALLAQTSRLILESGQVYLIRILGHSFKLQVRGSDLLVR